LAGSGTERWNESVPDAAVAWARALGLPTEPSRQELAAHLTRMDFGDPSDVAAVTLFVSQGAGHTWPGSTLPVLPTSPVSPLSRLFMRLILGRTSKEIDATSEIWQATGTPA
jgi:poly(3-hydroxybutyrate) depolymerase